MYIPLNGSKYSRKDQICGRQPSKNLKWYDMLDKVFKNRPSEICWRQPSKNLKWYGLLKRTISLQNFQRLSSTNFTWSILEYFVPNEAALKTLKLFCICKKNLLEKLCSNSIITSLGNNAFGIVSKFGFIFKRINSILKRIWMKLKGVKSFLKRIEASFRKRLRKRANSEAGLERIWSEFVNIKTEKWIYDCPNFASIWENIKSPS